MASVFAQTFQPDEVIVIDDGSIDNTKSMTYSEFPGVKYFYQDNKGVSAARNLGISIATGQYLAFLDSDDEWLPEKLAKQVQQLESAADIKVCHTEEIWIRNGVRVNAMKKHAKRGGYIYQYCLPLCVMSPSSIMIHRSVFHRVGVFDENLPACEDYDLWLRITAIFPVIYISQPLIVKYGGHNDQLSSRYWGMDRFRIQALEKILASNELSAENINATVNTLLHKAKIFKQGSIKRGKQEQAMFYQKLIEHYSDT